MPLARATRTVESLAGQSAAGRRGRLANADGAFETAHYSFEFHAVDLGREPRAWLVSVTDITAREQQQRELEDLRTQVQTQGEILRGVLQAGGARFSAFLQRTDCLDEGHQRF